MKVADAFEHKAIAELLKLILGIIQEVLRSRIFTSQTLCHECSDGKLVPNGGYNRRIRTSTGEFILYFKRVKCCKCGVPSASLQKLIKFGRYQTKTNELEKRIAGTISETSSCRGVAQLSRNGKISLPYRTANDGIGKRRILSCLRTQSSSAMARNQVWVWPIRLPIMWMSSKDAKKVAGIILKRFANANEWEKEWIERMNVIGDVVISVDNYKCLSPNFAH